MEHQIDLSVIIPFYNGEKFISNLLQSLSNSYKIAANSNLKLEVILIIDSPQTIVDSVRDIIYDNFETLNVRIEKNIRNIGVAATRNVGIDLSRGKYLYFIDQDDEVLPAFFSALLSSNFMEFDFVLLNGVFFQNNKQTCKIYYLKPTLKIENLVTDDFIRSPGQVLVKKEILRSNIRFPVPANHFGSDDKFFYITLFKLAMPKVLYINTPLYQANIHENNYSNDTTESALSSLELFRTIESELIFNASERKNIDKTKLMLLYNLGNLTGLAKLSGLIYFAQYKLKLNKLIRYAVRALQR